MMGQKNNKKTLLVVLLIIIIVVIVLVIYFKLKDNKNIPFIKPSKKEEQSYYCSKTLEEIDEKMLTKSELIITFNYKDNTVLSAKTGVRNTYYADIFEDIKKIPKQDGATYTFDDKNKTFEVLRDATIMKYSDGKEYTKDQYLDYMRLNDYNCVLKTK